jgi:hypothetical protein
MLGSYQVCAFIDNLMSRQLVASLWKYGSLNVIYINKAYDTKLGITYFLLKKEHELGDVWVT